jgi:hypothetical protein
MLSDNRHALTVAGDNLRAMVNLHGAVSVQIERSGGAFSIVFVDGGGNLIEQLPAPVGITLPAASVLNTVFASFAGQNENWGGQWDDLHRTIFFTTPFSGTYEVMENDMEIADISHLSEEVQGMVQFMVSKGFFGLNNGAFEPSGVLTRYEFSSAIVRMFFAVDHNLSTSFVDVPVNSPFYSFIASGEHEGLVSGIGNNLFAGERNMTRQEAVSVAARTLINRRGFSEPANAESILSLFGDNQDVSDWARGTVALAAREGLVGMSGNFAPLRDISRTEAAIIMYRLFMLLHETPPVVIEMTPLGSFGNTEVVPAVAMQNGGSSDSSFPLFPVVASAVGGMALVAGLWVAYSIGKKNATKP